MADMLREHSTNPALAVSKYEEASRGTATRRGKELSAYLLNKTIFWRQKGLPPCASLLENKRKYRSTIDSANTFANECCNLTLGKTPTDGTLSDFGVQNLHKFYSAWCRADGRSPMDVSGFKQRSASSAQLAATAPKTLARSVSSLG